MRVIRGLLSMLLLVGVAHGNDAKTEALLASGDVRVTSRAVPDDGVYVGQRAVVQFDLMTTSFFKGAPTWRVPDVGGAIVRQESQFAVNGTKSLGGKTYATQTWTLHVYPRQAGTLEIQPFDVTMRVEADGETAAVTTQVPAASIEVRPVPGASSDVIAARAFDAETKIEGATDTLKVGDAVRRTVTLTIEDAPAMLIPPLPLTALDGVATYPAPPLVNDVMNRGEITGTRIESTSYVFERSGTYTLPEVRVPYLDLEAGLLRDVVLEAVHFEVAENPDLVAGVEAPEDDVEAAAPAERLALLPWLIGLVVAGFFVGLLWRLFGARLTVWIPAARRERETSEAAYFARVESACRANDAPATMNELLAWIDRRGPGTGSVSDFVRATGDAGLAAAVADLETYLYASDGRGRWRGEALGAALVRAREITVHARDRLEEPLRLNPS